MSFRFLSKTSDVPAGRGKLFNVEGRNIAVFNLGGKFYGIDDLCTHEEASLADGAIDGETVECPWHGALFNIKTGAALTMPAVTAVRTYAVNVEGDSLMINVESASPSKTGA